MFQPKKLLLCSTIIAIIIVLNIVIQKVNHVSNDITDDTWNHLSLQYNEPPLLADLFMRGFILTAIVNIVGYKHDSFQHSTWILNDKYHSFSVIKCGHGHTLVIKFYTTTLYDIVNISAKTSNVEFTYANRNVTRLPVLSNTKYLTFCTMIKLDAMHTDYHSAVNLLHEWLTYHAIQGVEHFTVYYVGILPDWLYTHPNVELVEWYVGFQIHQQAWETSCIHRHRYESYWVGLLDVDEFIQPMQNKSVKEILYDNYNPDTGGIDLVSHVFQPHQPKNSQVTWKDTILQTFQPRDNLITYIQHIFTPSLINQLYTNPYNTTLITQSWFYMSPHRGRQKCIVLPENVDTFSVHGVTHGKDLIRLDYEHTMRLNHYRYDCKFCQGVFKVDTSMLVYLQTLNDSKIIY